MKIYAAMLFFFMSILASLEDEISFYSKNSNFIFDFVIFRFLKSWCHLFKNLTWIFNYSLFEWHSILPKKRGIVTQKVGFLLKQLKNHLMFSLYWIEKWLFMCNYINFLKIMNSIFWIYCIQFTFHTHCVKLLDVRSFQSP